MEFKFSNSVVQKLTGSAPNNEISYLHLIITFLLACDRNSALTVAQ
jgi:hypothetical protein